MLRKCLCLLLPVLVLSVFSPSTLPAIEGAQSPDDDLFFSEITPLVVTASKKAESMDTAPNVMYVVTKEQIKARGYRNLKDVLQVVPGFSVFLGGYDFYLGQVRGIAGDSNERITFMINGKIIEGIHLPNFLGGAFNLDNVEKIEIIVGPGSVLYGAKTLAGIVNMITKKPDGTEVIAAAGNFNNASLSVISGKKLDEKNNIMASLTVANQGGWDAYWTRPVNGRRADWINAVDPSPMLYAQATLGEWNIQGLSYHELYQDNFISSADNLDKTYQYIDSLMVKKTSQLTDNLSSNLTVSVDGKRWGTYAPTAAIASEWDFYQTSYGLEYAIQHTKGKNFFQAGLQYEYNVNKQNYLFSNFDLTLPYTSTRAYVTSTVKPIDTKAMGAYVSDDYQLSDMWKLVGALRADRNTEMTEDKYYYSPRAAVIFMPEKKLTVKLMYNTATRFPLTFESQSNNIWGKENPYSTRNANYLTSKPEVLTATELQTIYYLGKSRFSLNIYQQTLTDFMAFSSPFTNVGDFDGTGVEFAGNTSLGSALSLWYNGTYSKNTFTLKGSVTGGLGALAVPVNPDKLTESSPQYTASVGADYSPLEKLTLTSAVRYFTRQPGMYNGAWTYIDDRSYVDAAVTWKLLKSLDLRLSGQNLANNTDYVAAQFTTYTYIPQGPTYDLTAYYRF